MNTLSSDGEDLIKSFELLALTAYPDSGGVWTIGWGHVPAIEGQTCTAEQAEVWFDEDVRDATESVSAHLRTNCTQYQFDALVSFTFNVGEGAEAHSSLLRFVNQRQWALAAAEFPKWDHVNGKVVGGLLRRRIAEQALFEGGDWRGAALV